MSSCLNVNQDQNQELNILKKYVKRRRYILKTILLFHFINSINGHLGIIMSINQMLFVFLFQQS